MFPSPRADEPSPLETVRRHGALGWEPFETVIVVETDPGSESGGEERRVPSRGAGQP